MPIFKKIRTLFAKKPKPVKVPENLVGAERSAFREYASKLPDAELDRIARNLSELRKTPAGDILGQMALAERIRRNKPGRNL